MEMSMVETTTCVPGDKRSVCGSIVPEVNGVATALLLLATVAVILRLVSRKLSSASLWFDDFVIILALLTSYGASAVVFVDARYGVGHHFEIVKGSDLLILFQATVAYEILYAVTIALIKLSILLFYQRLFGVRKTFKKFVWAIMAIVICWCLAFVFVAIFQCLPVKAAWIKPYPGAKCVNGNAYLIASSVSNVIIDSMVLILPMWVVWHLRLSIRSKIALSCIFFVGAFICAAAIARAWAIANIDQTDVTWSYVRPIIWSCVEISVGITCACLPILQPVLNAAFSPCLGKVLGSTSKRNTYGTSTSQNWPGRGNSRSQISRPQAPGRAGQWGRLGDGSMGGMGGGSMPGMGREVQTSAWASVNGLNHLNDEGESVGSDDAIPLKGITVQRDLDQNLEQPVQHPGQAV